QVLGIRLGIIRYYPFFEPKSVFHARMTKVQEQCPKGSAKAAQRERYVALKQASGNSAVALLVSASLLTFGDAQFQIPLWPVWSLAVLLLLAHLETVYNQRSWEWQTITETPVENI